MSILLSLPLNRLNGLFGKLREILDIGHGYGGEVVFAFIELGLKTGEIERGERRHLGSLTEQTKNVGQIKSQLNDLQISNKKVAVWGGTGKAAAFINYYQLDSGAL